MIDIATSDISTLQDAMERGELTARQLVLHYFSRIAQIDQCEGGLNAVLEVNPDALFTADALDAERTQGHVRSPLHGIPIMLKDTINTADKMHTSAGSLALAGNLAPYDAHVVTHLRRAGDPVGQDQHDRVCQLYGPQHTGRLTEPGYLEALAKREQAIHRLDTLFGSQQIDVLLCPQPEIVAPITGFPSMTLPIGTQENRMPNGAYWIARRYDEATMLRIAYSAECALGVQCLPQETGGLASKPGF